MSRKTYPPDYRAHIVALARHGLFDALAAEFSDVDPALPALDGPVLPQGLDWRAASHAHRALAGQVLRTEVYTEDEAGQPATLHSVEEVQVQVVSEQPAGTDHPPAFRVDALRTRTAHYELPLSEPLPALAPRRDRAGRRVGGWRPTSSGPGLMGQA